MGLPGLARRGRQSGGWAGAYSIAIPDYIGGKFVKYPIIGLAIISLLALLAAVGCGGGATATSEVVRPADTATPVVARSEESDGEHNGAGAVGERGGEHRAGGESGGEHSGEGDAGGESGEESGTQLGLGDTYDAVRAGARLIIAYDRGRNAFVGTVRNVTNGALERVRVEVHLSNGIELGPTTPVDLAPGQVVDVVLEASEQPFESWSAHPEVG